MTTAALARPRCAALLTLALLSTACFTPADFGAGVAVEGHGDDAGHGEAAQPEAPHEIIVEGIIPGTEGATLDIKLPEIVYDPPFDGKPLNSNTLANGVVTEDFVLGEGEAVGDGKIITFSFKGFATTSGAFVMGTRGAPSKLPINESTRSSDLITGAMVAGFDGMKPGGKRRIKIPANIVEEGAPDGAPSLGDLMLTVEMLSVEIAPVLHDVDAYAGEPVNSQKRSNGLEIYDYAAGEGVAAKAGDQVVAHYIGQLSDGSEFERSHGRPDGFGVIVGGPGAIAGFSQGLEGVKAGMLRKLVIPSELGYGESERPKIPANSTLVFYLQIMSVTPGTGAVQEAVIQRKPADAR